MMNSLTPSSVHQSTLSTSENHPNLREGSQGTSKAHAREEDSVGKATIPQRRKYQPMNSTSLGISKRIPLIPLRTKDDDSGGINASISIANQSTDDETVSFSLEALLGVANGERSALPLNKASLRQVDSKSTPSLGPSQRLSVDESEGSNDAELSFSNTMKIPENILEVYKQEAAKIRGVKSYASMGSVFREDEEIEIRRLVPNTAKPLDKDRPSARDTRTTVPHEGKLANNYHPEGRSPEILDWFGPLLSTKNSFVEVNGRTYLRLGVLGRGGSTTVYRIMSQEGELLAYKRIQVQGSEENCVAQCRSYSNEINLLMKLKGSPNIIELLDFSVDLKEFSISMIMEAGEIDLARVITSRAGNYDGFFTRNVWREMLTAVEFIHNQRIVHSGNYLRISSISY